MKESYRNLKHIFDILQYPTQDFPFVFVADLKLLNLVFGLSTNAAKHPCSFCDKHITVTNPSKANQLQSGNLRTYKNVCDNVAALEAQGATGHHSNHASCVQKPLAIFSNRPNVPFIDIAAQPSLHYMLGANTPIHEIEALWDGVSDWWRSYSIVRSDYHG